VSDPFSDRLPVRRVQRRDDTRIDPGRWPASIPAVCQLLAEGLELTALTVLVGENGSGKSTLVEGLAGAYGLSPEGGSTGARHSTRVTESPLSSWLELRRGIGAARWGFFLRAETMHGLYTYLEESAKDVPGGPRDSAFHEMSHGESFLEVLATRFEGPGLYVLDEPESALSFTASLSLVALLHELASTGSAQMIVATHSPVIASVPGARILELGEWGWRECAWEDLALVQDWRAYLADPQNFLRHLL
jgi:predicted ATPase